MNQKLIAVILAGGAGSRFWPFKTSKVLFPFLGKPLFEFSVLDQLPDEVTDIVIVSNSENRQAIESIKLPKPSVTVLQQHPLGMANALLSAATELRDARLLIIIADDIASPDLLRGVLNAAKKEKSFAVLPGWKPAEYFPGGYLRLDGNKVLGIVEKPDSMDLPSEYVAISGHYIADSNVLLDELSRIQGESDDAYERALTMLAVRENIVFTPYKGYFASLKYPWHTLDVMQSLFEARFRPSRGKNIDIRPNVTIEGDVGIGDNVKIFENTKIIGPCYIGDDTIIGNNNIIRSSYIGNNCVTGFSTDITRSYIGNNCWFHSNYIGDSVLEEHVTMGAGAILANLRLDDGEIFSTVKDSKNGTGRKKLGALIGRNVRIGVNASIMPGIKIGSGSFIGSGVILDRDVPEASYVAPIKNAFTITSNTRQVDLASRDEFKKRL